MGCTSLLMLIHNQLYFMLICTCIVFCRGGVSGRGTRRPLHRRLRPVWLPARPLHHATLQLGKQQAQKYVGHRFIMLAGVPGRSVFDLLTGEFPALDSGAQFVRESLSLNSKYIATSTFANCVISSCLQCNSSIHAKQHSLLFLHFSSMQIIITGWFLCS